VYSDWSKAVLDKSIKTCHHHTLEKLETTLLSVVVSHASLLFSHFPACLDQSIKHRKLFLDSLSQTLGLLAYTCGFIAAL